jgi:hypothetical protein
MTDSTITMEELSHIHEQQLPSELLRAIEEATHNITDMQGPQRLITASEDGKRWSYQFISATAISTVGLTIGAAIVFINPFAGSAVVGVSIVSSTLAYYMPRREDRNKQSN